EGHDPVIGYTTRCRGARRSLLRHAESPTAPHLPERKGPFRARRRQRAFGLRYAAAPTPCPYALPPLQGLCMSWRYGAGTGSPVRVVRTALSPPFSADDRWRGWISFGPPRNVPSGSPPRS